jgi:hypothetical protein
MGKSITHSMQTVIFSYERKKNINNNKFKSNSQSVKQFTKRIHN